MRVISNYFSTHNEQMDKSLDDFQEPKKKCNGPKLPKKPASKKQSKRTSKKENGQKDIRTVLKAKKENLVSYSTEFHNVCLESGVDVDPEQLQIAIALSKSLNDFERQPQPSTSQTEKSEGSQDRITKIRTTLLEYGFSVPEIKRTKDVKRGVRKCIKKSKLLLSTNEEKKQKIADKVSQILFEFSTDTDDVTTVIENHLKSRRHNNLFDIAAKPFEHLKDDKCFYVGNLVAFSPNAVGCLLKDWSEIPGRPVSPPSFVENEVHFTDYVKLQEDLDVILTGTMQVIGKVLDTLRNCNERKQEKVLLEHSPESVEFDSKTKINEYSKTYSVESQNPNKTIPMTNFIRNTSPDLFEEEPSINEIPDVPETYEIPNYISDKDLMHDKTMKMPTSVGLSVDSTKRISNDFMDLTECINSNLCHNQPVDKLLLTNSPTYDLTQSSESSQDSLPDVHLSSKDYNYSIKLSSSPDNKVKYCKVNQTTNEHYENDECKGTSNSLDSKSSDKNLSQESRGSQDINLFCGMESKKSGVFDDFSFHHSSLSENNSSKEVTMHENVDINCSNFKKAYECVTGVNVDLTQYSNSNDANILADDLNVDILNIDTSQNKNSVLDHIVLDSSTGSFVENDEDQTLEYSKHYIYDVKNIDCDKIVTNDIHNDHAKIETEESALMKNDVENSLKLLSQHCSDNLKDNLEKEEQCTSSSQLSAVFEISDEELDYSMQYFKSCKMISSPDHKRCDQICDQLQGSPNIARRSSILPNTMCDSPKIAGHSNRKLSDDKPGTPFVLNSDTSHSRRFSLSESLPAVEIKGTKVKTKSPNEIAIPINQMTPVQETKNTDSRQVFDVETPTHSGYIVKTTDVTPMLDYASLDTPERNKELEKYGVKPFKRKRAVQLLQYLYCQTHPFVEYCDPDGVETPIKKAKSSEITQNTAEIQADLPNKNGEKVDHKESEVDLKIYEATNDIPVLKNIPFDTEDWIFQKREKAKVHGCRVPLHVALHNYVAARPMLRDAMLRYEPVSIEVVHKQLSKDGHRYDAKDLLRFLDKRCITVKTADNNSRNGKKNQQSNIQ